MSNSVYQRKVCISLTASEAEALAVGIKFGTTQLVGRELTAYNRAVKKLEDARYEQSRAMQMKELQGPAEVPVGLRRDR